MNPDEVSIIISCFNEEDTIQECLQRILQAMPGAEILVLHGGRDRTAERARELAANHPNVRVFKHYGDSGKGHAIKTGITVAKHDLMVQFDADMQFVPEETPKLLEPILQGKADVVFGARFMKESNVENYRFSLFRVLGNRIVNGYFSLLVGRPMYDVTTGFKAWTRQAIEAIEFHDNHFLYEGEIAVKCGRRGLRLVMVPVTYHNRMGGVSGHGSGLKETFSIVVTGLRILWCATLWRFGLKR
jgi:glycosyltransferase involved in cell wall biosynthesis